MPRPKTVSDRDILECALQLMHAHGPDAVTFAALSRATGLSASTLVQRFGTKSRLVRRTLLHAWDHLAERTNMLAASVPRGPEGAVELLVGLSRNYGGIDEYAEGLLILREDLRDPVLRSRGGEWRRALCEVLDDCLSAVPGAPPGIGLLMASQWQGSLLWWSFEPTVPVEAFVEDGLRRFLDAFGISPHKEARSGTEAMSRSGPDGGG